MSNNAWDIVAINTTEKAKVMNVDVQPGDTIVIVRKGIMGLVSSQLKRVPRDKKGATIVRKLGYTLGDCGNIHYGDEVNNQTLSELLI